MQQRPRMKGEGFGSGSSHQFSHCSITSAPSRNKRATSKSSGHSRRTSSNIAIHHSNGSCTNKKNLMDPPSFKPTRQWSLSCIPNSRSHDISTRSTLSDADNVSAPISRSNNTLLEPHLIQLMNEVNEEILEDEDSLFAQENEMGDEQGDHDSLGSATQKQRKPGGPLVGKDLAPEDGTVWEMQCNSDGQLVGNVARKLAIRVGQYARKHHYFPIDIKDLRKVSDRSIEDIYKVIEDQDMPVHRLKFAVWILAQ